MNLQPYSKAIAAIVSYVVVALLAKNNIVLNADMLSNVNLVIGGIVVAASVYLAPKNQ